MPIDWWMSKGNMHLYNRISFAQKGTGYPCVLHQWISKIIDRVKEAIHKGPKSRVSMDMEYPEWESLWSIVLADWGWGCRETRREGMRTTNRNKLSLQADENDDGACATL